MTRKGAWIGKCWVCRKGVRAGKGTYVQDKHVLVGIHSLPVRRLVHYGECQYSAAQRLAS